MAAPTTQAPAPDGAGVRDRPPAGPSPSRALLRRLLWPGALVLPVGGLYLATLLTVPGYSGDTAKFQYIASVLGTSHPPGQPTYLMLSHLFGVVAPGLSPAFEASLLSAVAGLAALLVLYRLLRVLGNQRLVAYAVTASFALMPTFWTQAVVAEVYTLLALMVVGTVYLLVRWRDTGRRGLLLAALAVYALSVGVHTLVAVLAPGIVYFVWAADRRVLWDWRVVLPALLLGLAGVAQYGYIAWRTSVPTSPYVEASISDWPSFWAVISGQQFRTWMFPFTVEQLLTTRLPAFARLVAREFLVLLPVALVGFIRLGRTPLNVALVLWTGAVAGFAINYNVPDLPVFFLSCYLLATVWLAAGVTAIGERLRGRVRHASAGALLLLPLLFGAVNHPLADQRSNDGRALWAQDVLAQVPDGAVIYPGRYDYSQYLWYYTIGQGVGRQRDVYVVSYKTPITGLLDYLAGDPLHIPEQRLTVPPGRPVFTLVESDAAYLHNAGFIVTPIDRPAHTLYRIRDPEAITTTESQPAPG